MKHRVWFAGALALALAWAVGTPCGARCRLCGQHSRQRQRLGAGCRAVAHPATRVERRHATRWRHGDGGRRHLCRVRLQRNLGHGSGTHRDPLAQSAGREAHLAVAELDAGLHPAHLVQLHHRRWLRRLGRAPVGHRDPGQPGRWQRCARRDDPELLLAPERRHGGRRTARRHLLRVRAGPDPPRQPHRWHRRAWHLRLERGRQSGDPAQPGRKYRRQRHPDQRRSQYRR